MKGAPTTRSELSFLCVTLHYIKNFFNVVCCGQCLCNSVRYTWPK